MPVGRVFDAIQHVIQVGRKRVDVFWIERRDKGLIQPGVDLVNHLIAALLQGLDHGRGAGQRRIARLRTLHANSRGVHNNFRLGKKELVEPLLTGEKLHILCKLRLPVASPSLPEQASGADPQVRAGPPGPAAFGLLSPAGLMLYFIRDQEPRACERESSEDSFGASSFCSPFPCSAWIFT